MNEERNIIIVVDDEEINRGILANLFQGEYEILEADNGKSGLELITEYRSRISAVLLDVIMPVMDGSELIREMAKLDMLREIPVFIVTAESNPLVTEQAYHYGVMDVINKPIVPYIVKRRVKSVIELYSARERLGKTIDDQKTRLLEQAEEIISLSSGIIETLATIIEFRSGETGNHVRNIRRITEILLSDEDIGSGFPASVKMNIALASTLHDVGKILTPDYILNKPGPLNADEYAKMKLHAENGRIVLKRIPQLKGSELYPYAQDIALHHHERWDGRGYPEGLKGNEISMASQIVGIADVYDALVSKRCYKEPYSREEALHMINTGQCGIFSQTLLESFNKMEPAIWDTLYRQEYR